MDIKEEPCFLDLNSENEGECFLKHLGVKEVKIETSDSETKPELEEDSTCSKHHLMRFNENIKDSEVESKIDIKEEAWWLERTSCVHEDINDEDFCSTKPLSVYHDGVSSYASNSFSREELGNHISFNMEQDNPENKSGRKYQSQDRFATDKTSKETSICSEARDDGKIVCMASSSKKINVLQQKNKSKSDINKQICKSLWSCEYNKSYQHDVSEKCFKDMSYLEKQSLTLDSKETNKCDKSLNNFSSLKAQKLIDYGKKPHKCYNCNKVFTTSAHLKTHTLIHEGIKRHRCDICNKAFTHSTFLKTHKLIHLGIKPHKCNLCNSAFTNPSVLKKHKLYHEGIKPHKCNICDKAFTVLSDLKRHKLIHEGIKPYKCNICSKAFTDASSFKKHKLIHEGIKPHKCNICNKAFTLLSGLKRHKSIHKDTVI